MNRLRHLLTAASLFAVLWFSESRAVEPGFVPLLEGQQSQFWKQSGKGGLKIDNGVATTWLPKDGGYYGVAWFGQRMFTDFELKLEFQPEGQEFNSGIRLRFPDPGDDPKSVSVNGYEVCINDPDARDTFLTGGIQRHQPPTSSQLRPRSQWNEMSVVVTGQHYVVMLNGKVVNDFVGSKNLSGYIGLENHNRGFVRFRNMRIKELSAAPLVTIQTATNQPPQVATPSSNSVEQVKAAILGHAWAWNANGRSPSGHQVVFEANGTMRSPTGGNVYGWHWRYDATRQGLIINYTKGDVDRFFAFNADCTRFDSPDKQTFAVRAAPLPTAPSNQAAAAPAPLSQTDANAIARKLENTQWAYTDRTDSVSVPGGGSVTKDGAWLGLRFRGQGRFTAWHDQRILHEARWEVITPNSIRVHNCGPDPRVGLVLQFDPGITSFTSSNNSNVSGRRTGPAPNVDLLVGRWHWKGPGTVHFREDGMAYMEWQNGERGTWRSLGGDRYEANWAGGKFVDTIRMKSGNKELVCEDKGGRKFGAQRVIPK